MSQHTNNIVDLKQSQIDFLNAMANQYALQDLSKAIRVLVEYAIHEPERRDEIFAVIRCRDCG